MLRRIAESSVQRRWRNRGSHRRQRPLFGAAGPSQFVGKILSPFTTASLLSSISDEVACYEERPQQDFNLYSTVAIWWGKP